MTVTAAQVKELRERTGAAMMDCKRALQASNGDIEAAIAEMRKSGQAKAAKKASRTAREGVIIIMTTNDGKTAVMLEINSETDFVARDENFVKFANHVAQRALDEQVTDIAALAGLAYGAGSEHDIDHERQALIAKLGENINLRRIHNINTADGAIGAYVHGGRIGVLLELEAGNTDLAKDIAMHVAASNPEFIQPENIHEQRLDQEREIFTAQAQESGKPAEIIAKMIDGRIKKFVNEISLVGQPFIKNPEQTVGALLKEAKAKVKSFVRYEVGEGIAKEEVDFRTEVMAQVRGE